MSDEENPGSRTPTGASEGDDAEGAVDPKAQSRVSAQGAASDLARMGIDPRSLGLESSVPPAPPASRHQLTDPEQVDDETSSAPSARIVPLRPEFATRSEDALPPAPTAPWGQQDRAAQPVPGAMGPVEQMLARTASRKAAPRDPGRLIRTVARGLVTPDAAEASGNERELVAALRHRQTERRVVAFVAGKGGVGTTTTASGVGSAFAALREDRTVLVDIQAGTSSLAALHNLGDPVSASALLRGGELVGPATTAAGLGIIDGVGWEQPLERRDIARIIDRLGAEHSFNLLDVGRDPGEAAHAAMARCDQVVLVTTIGEVGLRALEVALSRVRQVNPFAAEAAVFAVVCQHDEAYRTAHRAITEQLRVAPARVVVVPPDPTLRSGQPFDPALVGPATREAMLEIGAAIALSGGAR